MAALNQTTLSTTMGISTTTMNVASATNITAPVNNFRQKLYVIPPTGGRGELVEVQAVSGTVITISRLSEFRMNFPSGSLVLIGSVDPTVMSFHEYDPVGVPGSTGSENLTVTPFVNVVNGNQWLQGLLQGAGSTSTGPFCWVPGWGNLLVPPGPTAAVASAAGVVLPTGPLFHITGTAAITGFTLPVGFNTGSFTVIPDAIFTWTAAGNIGLAGTAVVSKALTFTWDNNASKFFPSYIA